LDSSPDLSPFLLDLDLGLGSKDSDLEAMDLDLESLPASPLYLPKRQLFANYMHITEHLSDTATDVSMAELLARYLHAVDGDCDSELVDFWVRNNATYDKLIPAVRRCLHLPFRLQVHR